LFLSVFALSAGPRSGELLAVREPSSEGPLPPRLRPVFDERGLLGSVRWLSLRRRVRWLPRPSRFWPVRPELSRFGCGSVSALPENRANIRARSPGRFSSTTFLTGAAVGVIVATAAGSAAFRSCGTPESTSGSSLSPASV
jgi:hypothetical protein